MKIKQESFKEVSASEFVDLVDAARNVLRDQQSVNTDFHWAGWAERKIVWESLDLLKKSLLDLGINLDPLSDLTVVEY